MQELKFDHEAHAAKGLYVPPLGNAVENTNWEYVGGVLKEKQGLLWIEEIPEAAYINSTLAQLRETSVDVQGVAIVLRVDGKEAKAIFKPGDGVMMSGHSLSSGMRLPRSEDVPELKANVSIRIIDAANVQHRIPQQFCKAFYDNNVANKKALADTQAEIAAKSNKFKPENEI